MTRHITSRGRITLVALLSIASSGIARPDTALAQDALPSAEQLIARHVAAIGGRDAVLAQRVSRSTGSFEMPAVGWKGALTVVTQAPNRMVSRITAKGMPDVLSGYDGKVGWSVDPVAGARLLAGDELDVMRQSANALSAVRDASLFRSMQTMERGQSGGQPCYRIKLVWLSGRESTDCYETKAGLLIETEQIVSTPAGKIRVVATLSDYQKFGGVLFPTRTVLSMMGTQQVLTISDVQFDGVDTTLIDPPAEIRRLASSAKQTNVVQGNVATETRGTLQRTGRHHIGGSLFMLANLIPSSESPSFYQMNAGYELTPKDFISLEAITWKYHAPLGIPYGPSMGAAAEKYPGYVRGFGVGAAYQRFIWKGAYYAVHATPMVQQYVGSDGRGVQNGFQLFIANRLGYRVNLLASRVFLEPSVAITHWPINTNVPESFARMNRRWPNHFLFEPGLHFGYRL